MSSIEAKMNQGFFSASFYQEVTTTDADWVKISFIDYKGNELVTQNIKLIEVGSQPVHFSFDPRNIKTATRLIHGQLEGDEEIELKEKRATEIYIKRATGSNTTIRIFAWR